MLQPGDKVAVLDDELEGKVISVKQGRVQIETTEGFLLEYEENELVKIDSSQLSLRDHMIPFSEVIREKESFKKRRSQRVKPKERSAPPMEVDLHIHKLTRVQTFAMDERHGINIRRLVL